MPAFALAEGQQTFVTHVREVAATELRPLADAGEPGHVNRAALKAGRSLTR